MFVEGGVPLDVPVESLAVASPVAPQEALKGGKVPPLYYGTRRDQAWECSSSFKKKKKEIKDNFSRIRKNNNYITAYVHNTQKNPQNCIYS